MLVLERREDEGFWIGDEVYVTVVAIKGSRVKIGVDAPRGVVVVREELLSQGGAKDGGEQLTGPSCFTTAPR
jgi:carbon storage regulator